MVDEIGDENSFKSLFTVLITITVIFILIISFYGARNEEGTICFGHRYMEQSTDNFQNSDVFLEGTDVSLLQKYSIDNIGNTEYDFCYSLESNVSDAFRISIVNENGTVLAKDFINNETISYCTSIPVESLAKKGYIGLRCDSCEGNQRINIKEEVLGTTVKRVKNNGTVEIEYANTFAFSLFAKENCDRMITFFTRWYITLISFLGVALAIMLGTKKFKEEVLEDD